MMHHPIARWLTAPGVDRLASIQAASADDIAGLVLALRDPALVIIAKRPLCDTISMRAVLDAAPKPQFGVSRGFTKDVAGMEASARDQPVVLQTRIVFDHLVDATRRMAQTLRMLGGYDVEPAAWAPGIESQISQRLKTFARRRDAGVMLADTVASASAARLWPSAQLFVVSTDRTGVEPAPDVEYMPDDGRLQMAPTLDLVAAHGRFLAATDPEALAAMHTAVAPAAFEDVFAIWRSNLAIIAAQSGNDGTAGQGIQRLAELQRRYARQPAA